MDLRLCAVRLERRNDERSRLEVFPGDGFGLLEGHGFEKGVFAVEVRVAQAIELIQRGGHCKIAEVLPGDFLLADDFGLGAAEFLRCQAFMAQKLGVPMLKLAISVGSMPDARDYLALFDYNVASIARALGARNP